MDINMKNSSALIQNSGDAVGMTVLKKSIDLEAQSALSLINAVPPVPQAGSVNFPPNLGQKINTTA
ncbi:MAG: YjfB family protein [Gallionellaceae bacterium]|nr:YjfB family protein [Gallionellaceae bacterium]